MPLQKRYGAFGVCLLLISPSPIVSAVMAAADVSTAADCPAYPDVAPIFREKSTVCHSGDGAPKGLHLDSFDNIRKGSVEGPVVVPGNPEKSELIQRVKGISQPRMPLTGPPYLPDGSISVERIRRR